MRRFSLAIGMVLVICGVSRAQTVFPTSADQACLLAVAAAERASGIPPHLLAAINRVESGRRDEATGMVRPWPWTANAEGQGHFYATKADAIASVSAMQARGIRSVDVGCGQINLMHHPAAFPSLEQAFDPQANATYAALFLKELFAQTGDWTKAAAMYHSATPELGAEYQHKVMAAWPEEWRLAGRVGTTPLARAWAATMGSPLPSGFRTVVRRQQPNAVQGPRIMLSVLGGAAFPAARPAP
jgi:hypothetical protein